MRKRGAVLSGGGAGKTSQRQGSRSLDTGQYPAIVRRSSPAALAEPNSKTLVSGGDCCCCCWLEVTVELGFAGAPSASPSLEAFFLRHPPNRPIFAVAALLVLSYKMSNQ
ncbi:hypothetical protein GOP47_0017097, partial [Adiantum capillus-veneris]